MTAATGTSRIDRLDAHMREEGIDAFLANSPVTMGYLHDFREASHERFLTLAIRADGEVRWRLAHTDVVGAAELLGTQLILTSVSGATQSIDPVTGKAAR